MSTRPRTIVCGLEPKERHAGMKADFSWNSSGKLSADLYRELTGKA